MKTGYYFDVEGTNNMEKENVICLGTPSIPGGLVLLKAFNLGIEFIPSDCQFGYREVNYNGYKFNFTTFKSEALQKIHFNQIESDLLQAVGRARVGLHDCNVYIYSDFPLKNVKFVKLPELLTIAKDKRVGYYDEVKVEGE